MVRVFSGAVANGWDTKSTLIHAVDGNDNLMPELVARAVQSQQPRVLDVGCGTGKFAEWVEVALPRAEVTGIDVSTAMIEIARAKPWKGTPRFEVASLLDYSPGEPFDVVALRQVLHHIPDQKRAMDAVARLLSPDGVALLMLPSAEHASQVIPYRPGHDPLGRMDETAVASLADAAGLTIAEAQHRTHAARFASAFHYFQHLISIGSLQKIFDYRPDAAVVERFVELFAPILSTGNDISVDFGYSYYLLRKADW
ncbi:class I SAM-dependent methyltransferase [Nocardioides sp. NPDC023903]|uniref:class I SAM-dependent methyltransferase n=1 Tax=Nocardioides sp. NPDC023903 TaxID=3157195 RepID=UPI0033F093FE